MESRKRSLTILNVGHGNAAILSDEGGNVVFDTGRRGTEVLRFIRKNGIREIEALYLSHSDADHIGGASTLLLDPDVRVGHVYLNGDSTKRSKVHRQLRFAIVEARKKHGTTTHTELSTTLNETTPRPGTRIEVLYPPPEVLISGPGGVELTGESITSNSTSAVIRVGDTHSSSVLLCGDAEVACVQHWNTEGIDVRSAVLVFPHHGGRPGAANFEEVALFCRTLSTMVEPMHVVFSIHRTLHNLPRQEILDELLACRADVAFACTQLPLRFYASIQSASQWRHHLGPHGVTIPEADVTCELGEAELILALTLRSA